MCKESSMLTNMEDMVQSRDISPTTGDTSKAICEPLSCPDNWLALVFEHVAGRRPSLEALRSIF
jgi:hypothetical protein